MKTVYIAADGTAFANAKACRKHEALMLPKVKVPLWLLKEAMRQCTPYMVSAKERRELLAQLQLHIPR